MRTKSLVIILFVLSAVSAFAQEVYCPPPNIGFESGTFTGWSCDTGRVDFLGNVNLLPSDAVYDRQTIVDSAYYPQLDPWGNFPTLCPWGGRYSIRLGNQEIGKRAERISYTFTVPAGANEYDMIFYYAVVLQNPPHLSYQQPKFTVKTFDVTDATYVDCASFNFIASANLPGFKASPAGDTVFYKDWAPSTLHLRGYAGKQMRIEFTTNDCTLGHHFGYAYLDVNEDCNSPVTGNIYCTNQKSVTLLAPGGFGNYNWYTADLSKLVGVGQALTLSPPPADGTKYAVVLTPFFGLGCQDTLYSVVGKNDADFVFKVKDTLAACAGSTVDLTSASVTTGSSSDLSLSYSTDMDGLNYVYKPNRVDTSGTYYIKAVSKKGCSDILPVQVIIANPALIVTNPAPVLYPVTVDLSTTFVHDNNNTYSYFTNSEATIVMPDYRHAAHTGTYYIEATNKVGCATVKPVYITVTPPPPPAIKAVNAFTPNNDGINDYFSLTVSGYGKFSSLRIFDRYGHQVFQTLSEDGRWDGKYNGDPLPPGTYYWIFNGINTYYNSKVVESGYITLIR
ncbi:MAG TPA: gliding motility-associated C-terminal domain-containing protein [Mucilaginibacter sp.]|jgi:gliding motility-associated-like protein|nr:gliding motility-associated C-terminal domain-containing protein [Mucilaginibacter sp.]